MPRSWPWLVLGAAIAVPASYLWRELLGPTLWAAVSAGLTGAAIGVVIVATRWALWRRKYPWRPCLGCLLMSAAVREQERAHAQRKVARWQ